MLTILLRPVYPRRAATTLRPGLPPILAMDSSPLSLPFALELHSQRIRTSR